MNINIIMYPKKDRETKKSNCLVSILCCIFIFWGIAVCIFQEPCINAQITFGVGFRLLFDDNNNTGKKFIKLKTSLQGQPWKRNFCLCLQENHIHRPNGFSVTSGFRCVVKLASNSLYAFHNYWNKISLVLKTSL